MTRPHLLPQALTQALLHAVRRAHRPAHSRAAAVAAVVTVVLTGTILSSAATATPAHPGAAPGTRSASTCDAHTAYTGNPALHPADTGNCGQTMANLLMTTRHATATSTSTYNNGRGPNTTSRVVLSFDDCPRSLAAFKSTVLAAESLGIGLVLFPTGNCVLSGRFSAAYARAHGHYVFNHTISHPDLRTLSYAKVYYQLGPPGIVTTFGRPPYGATNTTVRNAYAARHMKIWLWTYDTNDWRGKTQATVVSLVVHNATAGSTILMHMQWNAFNGDALRRMKAGLAARGLSVCRNYPGTTPVAPVGTRC